MSTADHKSDAPASVAIGIISVSSSRRLANDVSGCWIRDQARREGHRVVHHSVVPDDAAAIRDLMGDVIRNAAPEVLLLTGGTGIAARDVTIEAVQPLFDKELTAFGALFAMLSFDQIGAPAILSRACAGIVRNTVVFCMPGSLKACQLACNRLIFSELGHLVRHRKIG